jgi:hypothetical protein
LIVEGLAVLVSWTYGVKEVAPAAVWIVAPGEFVPHQLLVAVTVLFTFSRLLPEVPALFPARRLRLIVSVVSQ